MDAFRELPPTVDDVRLGADGIETWIVLRVDRDNVMCTAKRVSVLVVLMVSTLLSSSAAADEPDSAAGDCTVEIFFAGVQCVDDQDERHWQIIHPATWHDIADFGEDASRIVEDHHELLIDDDIELVDHEVDEPVGPLEVDGRLFYAVRGDLLELDTRRGAVADRVRFPAVIDGLEPKGDDALNVELLYYDVDPRDYDTGETPERIHEITYRLDSTPPGQTDWSAPGVPPLAVVHDTSGVFDHVVAGDLDDDVIGRDEEGLLTFDEDLDEQGARRVVERLEKAYQRDPTNPFYQRHIGELWLHLGDDDRAAEAFELAANTDTVWRELLDVSTALEDLGATEAGQRAFDRGAERLEEAGIASERHGTLVQLVMTLMHHPQDDVGALRDAIEREDVEEVDRLSERFARLFPYGEGAHQGWFALADWFEQRDRPELADKWRDSAETNFAEACGMTGPENRRLLTIDRGFLVLLASGLALVLLLFLVGVRGGLARRRMVDEDDHDDDPGVLPRLKIWDFAGIALAVVVLMAVPFVLVAEARTINELADVPIEVADDGMASPIAEKTLEQLASSSARDELLEIARSEQEAFARGEDVLDKDNLCILNDGAFQRDSYGRLFDRLREGVLLDPVGDIVDDDLQFAAPAPDEVSGMSLWTAVSWLLPLALIFAVGVAVGRFVPPVGRWILRLVPGASIRPGVVADLAVFVFVVGLLAAAGFDSKFQEYVLPNFSMYYELNTITPEPEPEGIGPVAWVMIGGVLVAHIVAVIRGWSDDRD